MTWKTITGTKMCETRDNNENNTLSIWCQTNGFLTTQ